MSIKTRKEIIVGTYMHEPILDNTGDRRGWVSHSGFGGTNQWDEEIRKAGLEGKKLEVVLREKD